MALHGLADVGGNAALQLGLLRLLERGTLGGVEGQRRERGGGNRGHERGGGGVERERGPRDLVEDDGIARRMKTEIEHGLLKGGLHGRMEHARAEGRRGVQLGGGRKGGLGGEIAARIGGFGENSGRIGVEKCGVEGKRQGSGVVGGHETRRIEHIHFWSVKTQIERGTISRRHKSVPC